MAAFRRLCLFKPVGPGFPAARAHVRLIHATPVAAKKKVKRGGSSSEMFAAQDEYQEETQEDELFDFGGTVSKDSAQSAGSGVQTDILAEKFDAMFDFTSRRFTPDGEKKKGNPPRRSMVQQLCALAHTKEQLEKLLELVAVYRNASLTVDTSDFLGRCLASDCPELILRALQNRPKYGIDISSLKFARTILNALAMQKTDDIDALVANCLAFAELYPLYGLPPVSQDPVSSIILTGVIARRAAKKGDTQPAPDDIEAVHSYIPSVLENLKGAEADAKLGASGKEARWMRRSLNDILVVEQRTGKVQPWLMDLHRKLTGGSSVEISQEN